MGLRRVETTLGEPMDWKFKKLGPVVALTMVGLGSTGFAADNNKTDRARTEYDRARDRARDREKDRAQYDRARDRERAEQDRQMGNERMPGYGNMDACMPEPAAPCYSLDTPPCDYCLGPENVAGNPSVRPYTCGGDVVLEVAGFYWNAHQDGLEFALSDSVLAPATTTSNPSQLNNLIQAEYLNPKAKWELGFKLGLGYDSTHDGWDLMLLWTHYRGRAKKEADLDLEDNSSLLPLWSAFSTSAGVAGTGIDNLLYATNVEARWKLRLDLVDLELGREFWSSKYLTLRPHVGLRYVHIKQDYDIMHQGGAWSAVPPVTGGLQQAVNNEVDLDNKFRGIGVRAGLNSTWMLGRGFAFFGKAAISIVYGRFTIDADETNSLAQFPFSDTEILDTEEHFRSSKGMTDLEFGISWSTMFSDCQYGFTLALAWEHHLFFNQNQFWRVNRVGGQGGIAQPNNTGQNVFSKQSGDLSTQGWTLSATFEF
jgi:hypothetical protein